MKLNFVLIALLSLLTMGLVFAQPQQALVPYSPSLIQDKKGNEWFIEQNGGLQRNGSQPSMIGNAMMLQIGTQQFYSQQPMMSPDGSEIVMTTQQPMNGLTITRRITVMEREGALRYVEEFTNTTNRDVAFSAEFRHNFNNQTKGFLSDTGRPIKEGLQSGEFGILITANAEEKAPSVFLTVCAPGSQILPKVSGRSGYQMSVAYSLSIPAGQTTTLIHAIAQAKIGVGAKPADVAKAFQPLSMRHLTKGLAKATLKTAANLAHAGHDLGLDGWFQESFWGVSPETSDVLMLDDASRLKGRAAMTATTLTTSFGKAEIPWDKVAAMSGPGYTQTEESWLWLRDGQRWKGVLEPATLKFTLIGGTELQPPRLNRLIFRREMEAPPPTPAGALLLETWAGERLAFQAEGALKVDTPWGPWQIPWVEVMALIAADPDEIGGMLHLQDGTRLRALPASERISIKAKNFGPTQVDLGTVRQMIAPQLASAAAEDTEPVISFVELAGDQRLICRVTSETLRFLTTSGPVDLAPTAIREMHEMGDQEQADSKQPRRFQAELWGGGSLVGSLDNPQIKVEGRGFAWQLPVYQLTRIANPAPVTDSALMRRTGELIQSLGNADWKTRERATAELKELGPMVKSSLQEALKLSTDAEVTRRLETLLSDLD